MYLKLNKRISFELSQKDIRKKMRSCQDSYKKE